MAKSYSEKAADGLIQGVVRRDWNPQLFIGYVMEQSKEIQRMIIITALMLLRQYKTNADNEYLTWRIDPEAAEWISDTDLEPIDLTDHDQIQ